MIVGVLICAAGMIPLYFGGITLDTLEGMASLVAVGLLVFLVGVVVRRITKSIQT